MKGAKYHVVWNFRNKVGKDKTAPIHIDVYIREGERKYVHTGMYVTKDQFDPKNELIKNHNLQVKYNKRISKIIDEISDYEYKLLNEGDVFTLEKLNNFLNRDKGVNFLEFMKNKIKERTDISEATKTSHNSTRAMLEQFGKLKEFRDLTPSKLEKYEEFLRGEGRCQNTIHRHMRAIRSY